MSKIFGYVISLIGILVLAASLKPIQETTPFLKDIPVYALWAIGGIIIVIGLYTLRSSSSSKQPAEVPIYHGKNVVGFRRMGKK